jgi:hypothetical protein
MDLTKKVTGIFAVGTLAASLALLSGCEKNKTFYADLNNDGKKDKVTVCDNPQERKISMELTMSDPRGRFDLIYCSPRGEKFGDCMVTLYSGKIIKNIPFRNLRQERGRIKGYEPKALYVSFDGHRKIDLILR